MLNIVSATRWLRIALLSLGVVMLSAGSAAAQKKNDDYQRLVQQGLHEYDLGNFNEAKSFFAQAHALSPSARTLRGLGMSSYELRNYVEAIGYFDQALGSAERPLTVQMRGEVTQLLKQARAFVTKLKVTLEPASAELRVDTRRPVKDGAGYVLLDPGLHELVAEAPGHDGLTRNLRTDGGEELSLTMSLHATAKEPVAEAAGKTAAPREELGEATPPPPAPKESSGGSVGPWLLIGSSAAVTIAGGVLIALMVKDKNAVENPSGDTTWPEVRDAHDRVFPFSVAGFTALGVGVAGLIGGIAWKVGSSSESPKESGVQVGLVPGGLRVNGQF
jgi:hypothetical protein